MTSGPFLGHQAEPRQCGVTILVGPHRLRERVTSNVMAGLTLRKGDSGNKEGKKEKAANISFCDSGEKLPGIKGRGAGTGSPGGSGGTTRGQRHWGHHHH